MKPKKPSYLGDSVYVEFDGFMLGLYTDNGFGPSNEIFLERSVLKNLNDYANEVDNDQVVEEE